MASASKLLGAGLAHAARGVTRLFGRRAGARAAAHASAMLAPVIAVGTSRGGLRFRCGSAMSARHATGFLDHEPDTRWWIETHIRPGECLWDVGANIGLYTLYACSGAGVRAVSFEPVAGTFAHLAHNIALNGFGERATPLCVALSDSTGLQPLYLASNEPGTAMHALGRPENMRGEFESAGVQMVGAFRGDEIIRELGVPAPDHVKIDVDGHELRVLQGLGEWLGKARTVWIEMENSADDAKIEALLIATGLVPTAIAGPSGRNRLFVNRTKVD